MDSVPENLSVKFHGVLFEAAEHATDGKIIYFHLYHQTS